MKIRAIPNAKQFSLKKEGEAWVARIPAQAWGGKANKKLLALLSDAIGAKARLAKGAKSREKEIIFDGISDEEAEKKLEQMND